MKSEWPTADTAAVPARRSRRWRLGAAGLAVLLGAALALWLTVLPRLVRPAHPAATEDRLAAELANLKLLGLALRLHAEEHEGAFPPAISEINWRQTQPGLKRAGLPAAASRFHDPETGRLREWLYEPGKTLADPPETLLAVAPVALGSHKDKRLVVRVSGVAEIISEADYQREVPKTAGP